MIDIVPPSSGVTVFCSTAILLSLLLGNRVCWRQVLSYPLEVARSRFPIAAGLHPVTGTGSSHLGRKPLEEFPQQGCPYFQPGLSESGRGDQALRTGVGGRSGGGRWGSEQTRHSSIS